jgi:hypothetical protein
MTMLDLIPWYIDSAIIMFLAAVIINFDLRLEHLETQITRKET